MKAFLGAASLSLALLLAGCGGESGDNAASNGTAAANNAPLPQVEAPNGDWTQVVTKTADGGYVMGNPNAPVKLIEYASLTCPACKLFSDTASAELRDEYVKSGQVSWEFRNFVLNPIDLAAAMLVRCQPEGAFFGLVEQLYANQESWAGRFNEVPEAEMQRIQTLPREQQVAALAKAGQLDQFFRQRGMPENRINQCLSDPAHLQATVALNDVGQKNNVQGTPTFFINGEQVEGASQWDALEPKLREAIG